MNLSKNRMAELILNPPSLFGKQNDSHDIPILILHEKRDYYVFVCLMVLNATFNNISVISCLSVLLVEENGETGENHRPVASH